MIKLSDIKTPAYISDVNSLENNIIDILSIVRSKYNNFDVGYSYKTNYYIPFLDKAMSLGLYAEVVSPNECSLAQCIGNEKSNIIYNGVIHDFETKLDIARSGGIVNIENIPELTHFIEWSNQSRTHIELGIRVNFDVGNGLISRFGIDITGDDFLWLSNQDNHPYISFKCVHFHLGGARDPEYFRYRVKKTVEIAKVLGATIVDIGGNIYGRMGDDFKAQLPFAAPTLEEVCYAIGDEMSKCCPDGKIKLIAECGSPIASNAMHLLTTVTNINKVRGKVFVTTDCRNTDAGWSISRYDPTREYYGKCESGVINATVCGCECREKDILIRNYSGPLSIGGKLLIKNIGSYSYSVTNDFITPGCSNVIDISEIVF